MAISVMEDGGFSVTGKDSIELFRLLSLRSALRLEMKGMKMSRGVSASTILKREYGITGQRKTQLPKLDALIEEKGEAHLSKHNQ